MTHRHVPTVVTLRAESPDDALAIRRVHLEAFGQPEEADLVDQLREDGDIVCSLVAVVNGEIAGSIVFSQLTLGGTDRPVRAVALAPLAVLPSRQGMGIGSRLVRSGIEACARAGVDAIVVLGDPAYYARFGFMSERATRLDAPWSGPNLLALELTAGALRIEHATVSYPAAFEAAS